MGAIHLLNQRAKNGPDLEGKHVDCPILLVDRNKKGESLDMIPMDMGHKNEYIRIS